MSTSFPVTAIVGTPGGDDLAGTAGRDRVYGLSGADIIEGLAGDDGLWGGPGHDLLLGQADDDYLSGGPNPDIANWQAFALGEEVFVALTPGAPEITLHDVATGDRIGSLRPPGGGSRFDFGTTLATGGNRILVGVPGADTVGEDAGRAHLYDTDGRFIAHA